jgi:DNA (cytosine-5)-methyltransferase 3A
MNVLSLFDGISCGQVALNRAGIKYDKYFASEINGNSMKVCLDNYPDTIQLGDVREVRGSDLPKIDLLIGGSPCQDFSSANWIRDGLKGKKSNLFYQYLRILDETKPAYFLLENVGSMDDGDIQTISGLLKVYPVRINSSLVSAQQRDRLYWTNIPGKEMDLFGNKVIAQPEDKRIYLNDVLGEDFKETLLSDFATAKIKEQLGDREGIGYCFDGDSLRNEKSGALLVNGCSWSAKNTTMVIKNGNLRYFSQEEYEILQTLPRGYTKILCRSDAAKVIGDGWTVDVIAHIFQGLKSVHNSPENIAK